MKYKHRINGKWVSQEEWDAHPKHGMHPAAVRQRADPQMSLTFAFTRAQAKHERELDAKEGVPSTEYRKDYKGRFRPVWEGRTHAAKWQKARGYYNRDAGYGDAQPENR